MHRKAPLLKLLPPMLGAVWPLLAGAALVDVQVLGSDGKPLNDAVVFLESREARAAARPAQGVEIAQDNKQFSTRVTVVPVGTQVTFPNLDKVRHHVYSYSPAKTFDLKLYKGLEANPVLFDKSGVAVLGCNIHDHMIAWVVVVETPHYGRTPAGGRVKIDNVPAGSYRLRSWHPDLPVGAAALDQALDVPAAGVTTTVRLTVAAG
jgi:plastocyanin